MADKTIGELPELSQISDGSMLPVQDSGTAYHTKGSTWKSFVRGAVASDSASAANSADSAQNSATIATNKATEASSAEAAIRNLEVSGTQLESGLQPTVSKSVSGGVVHFRFGIPAGPRGEQGSVGPAGQQGPRGPRGDTGTAVVIPVSGLVTFWVDNDSQSATYGHLFVTYAGDESSADAWYVDRVEGSPTYGHLLYNPEL